MDVVIPDPLLEAQLHLGPIDLREASTSATGLLKRSAAEAFEESADEGPSCKKLRGGEGEDKDKDGGEQGADDGHGGSGSVDGNGLADNLEEELQCGCCSAIVYRPVVVAPCQHFFCGSCVTLWVRNGGTSCPACRSVALNVSFSRPLQKVVDTLLRHAPDKARSLSERIQADAIYQPGIHLRIPSPRQASPEPAMPTANTIYVRPCPHCLPGNQWGWRCPQPIVDPDLDHNHAWLSEDGNPPGHGVCGNCENILALQAPTTTRCDLCQVSFCGIGIPQRCIAVPLTIQHPHGLADLGDLIQCGEIYECFDGNTVEVDIMLDYLNAQRLSPRHIYREIVMHIQSQPRQFLPLMELELFTDVHPVASGVDPDPAAPRSKICRVCATEILLYGLREWWIRERKKGFLEQYLLARPDCPAGSQCPRQKNQDHAKEFNHIVAPPELPAPVDPAPHHAHTSLLVPQPVPLMAPATNSTAPVVRDDVPSQAPDVNGNVAAVRENVAVPVDASANLPPLFVPLAIPAVPIADLPGYASAPSSQDFRDEVDALL